MLRAATSAARADTIAVDLTAGSGSRLAPAAPPARVPAGPRTAARGTPVVLRKRDRQAAARAHSQERECLGLQRVAVGADRLDRLYRHGESPSIRMSVPLRRPPPVTSQRPGGCGRAAAARHGLGGECRERRGAVLKSQTPDRRQRKSSGRATGGRSVEIWMRAVRRADLVDPPGRRDPPVRVVRATGVRSYPVVDQAVARPGIEREQRAPSPIQVSCRRRPG